jgi:hypothetical protein
MSNKQVFITNHMSRANGLNLTRFDGKKDRGRGMLWMAPGETIAMDADEWAKYVKVTPAVQALLAQGALETGNKMRGPVKPTFDRSSCPVPPEHLQDPLAKTPEKHKLERKVTVEEMELPDPLAMDDEPVTRPRGK